MDSSYLSNKGGRMTTKSVPNSFTKGAFGSLTYMDFSRSKYMNHKPVNLLSVALNDSCNLECPQCIEKFTRGKDHIELLYEMIEELEPGEVTWFSVAGKEPTITPDRLEKIAKLARPKVDKVILMTNGILFDDYMQKKLENLIDYVDFSFDGIELKDGNKSLANEKYARAWTNIGLAVNNGFKKTSVITTVMPENYQKIGALVDLVANEFQGRVAHSIGFYLGWPKDKRLLSEEQVVRTISQVATKDAKTVIFIAPAYSYLLPGIFKEFGINPASKRYDPTTQIPAFDLNGHKLITVTHLEAPTYLLRAEPDGNVYFGCTHLMVKGDASKYALGNLKDKSLRQIFEDINSGSGELMDLASKISDCCVYSDCFSSCRGGDRLGGYILNGKAQDPFCRKINEL